MGNGGLQIILRVVVFGSCSDFDDPQILTQIGMSTYLRELVEPATGPVTLQNYLRAYVKELEKRTRHRLPDFCYRDLGERLNFRSN